ncbi:MAG: hypothetical protein Q9166_007527 [cf. Caloplaca sp. 2 TL-2023]
MSATLIPPVDSFQQCDVLLFGDLTIAFEDDLRQLLHCKSNATLQSFFDQVALAFRQEFALLPAEEQGWLPHFTDLVDLIANIDGTVGAQALRFGLLCVYQLGRFINSDTYPDTANSYLIGVCTGSFAATAISSSRTMTELVPAGVEAVLVAFRTGLHSLKMQRDIEPLSFEGSRSWSYIFSLPESKALEILRTFSAEACLPRSSQPYVSAVTPSTVTISGPPRVLEHLTNSFGLQAHPIPIQTPAHATHLNGVEEVDEILGCLRNERLKDYRPRIPLLSTAAGTLMEAEDFSGLLRQAVTETLCQQVRWDKICLGLSYRLAQNQSLSSCVVSPVASSAASLLCSALQRDTTLSVTISNALNTKIESVHTSPALGKFQGSKIAIVGYSGRFPEAASNEGLWEVLKAARDTHRTVPEDRFDWEAHYDSSGKKKNTSRVKFGCFINDPGVFDARFFNISPREAENMDPGQRLALMCVYEAVEMAGLVPDRTPSTKKDRIGVFFGVTSDDWREVNSGQNVDTYFIPGGNRAFVPGRISYFFRFSGPSISVDTACSSSFTAISTACSSLEQGECDSAIAGGTNVLTNPDNFVGLDRGHFLSTTGNCNPFDDSADGYCRADAVGAVVLKRLEDAQADNDPIFGVIAGSSTNHCGQTISITRPHEGDQLSLFRRILRHTNTNPTDVSYVEMHGTGTQAGDATEMHSVLSAFAWDDRRSNVTPPRPLYLGAVKANVGHSESASGVTALIKVLMMMKYSEIPPHRLDGELNHHYPTDMADRNVHIAFKPTPWRREICPTGKRVSFLNNFSAAGGNTAILLEDAPCRTPSAVLTDPRTVHPVTVSAKTTKALEDNFRALINYLENNPATSLPALSYTTTARRAHYKFRALVSGADITAVKAALQRRADNLVKIKAIQSEPPKIVFAFTGQGTLYTGIGSQLFDQVSVFRAEILRFHRIAQRQGFPSFLPLISGEGSVEAQNDNSIVLQLAVVCVQMALSHLWTLWVGEPSSVIGHSLGEYAALYAAGVLSASNTIHLVGSRAQLIDKYCTKSTHSMLAVKAPLATVIPELADTPCTIACINSPTNVVASGPERSIKQLSETFSSKNVDAVLLDIPYAFHSAQVEPILAEFETLASNVPFHKPTVPYMSPLLTKTVNEAGNLNASYVTRATRECVNFQGAIEAARDAKLVNDSTIWIEIGAHPACSGMIKQIIGSHAFTAPTLRKDVDTWKVLMGSIESIYQAGADIRWEEFHHGFEAAQEVLPLPSYQWDLKNYWIQYRYNFCLTKGDDPATFAPQAPLALSAAPPTAPSLSSSVHSVLEENNSTEKSTLLTESDLHDPRLAHIVSGHKVNTAMLCTSSLYADMALTIAKYMLKSNGLLDDKIGLDCGAMSIQRPLIAQPDAASQLLRVSANADWSKKEVSLSFFSVDTNARKLAAHASCMVKITEKQNWLDDWKRSAYLITSRIASLGLAVDTGSSHKLKRGLVYKLFSSLVDYAPSYQGMQQVILDSECLEATAEVKFQVDNQGFDWNPCWIESLGSITGFIMNGNDNISSKDQVFVNHGWDAMRYGKQIESGKSYTTYNRMQLESGTMYAGDTYIFEGQELVAIFEGVRFQGVNRSVLDYLLPGKARAAASKAAPAAPSGKGTTAPASIQKKPTPSKQTPTPSQKQPSKVAGAMKIIAEEAQIDQDEVDPDTEFTDLGVDSLLSLTIASRLQEELGIDISSSAFVDYPTIKALISYIRRDEATVVESTQPSSVQSGASTPPAVDDEEEESYSTDASTFDGDSSEPNVNIMAIIRRVISQETGIAIEDISSDLPLADLGVDSLLGLTIMGTLSEQIDTQLPSSLFADSETLGDIEASLCEVGVISSAKPKGAAFTREARKDAASAEDTDARLSSVPKNYDGLSAPPYATSVVLQGSPKTAKETLFLFPDGAGSATSYIALPNISPDVVVYGLNCPWLKTPQDLKCSFGHYVAKFLVEVLRRQPHGPYNFGGASAGGILAYEAAQQLEGVGEKVARLILLDSPDPVGLENPHQRMYDFLESLGMFGMKGKAPKWLRPHFDAFLAVLDSYNVKKFTGSTPPATYIIYARDGMCKYESDPRPELRPDDPREMWWLLNNRTDFSGAGWNTLLGKENLHVSVLDDVNHYTIFQEGPKIKELSALIARALQV